VFKVVLAGSANVGKSTIFNIFSKKRISVESEVPGTTRDPLDNIVEVYDKKILLIDSGGFEFKNNDPIYSQVREKAFNVIESADLILFVVDRHTISEEDIQYLRYIKKTGIPFTVVANKAEKKGDDIPDQDLYSLGVSDFIMISAIQKKNLSEIDDYMYSFIKDIDDEVIEETDDIKIAIVGRPNVGKSSLLNVISNSEKSIVSDIAGTTIDAIDETIEYNGKKMTFIDTAGIRRKRSISEQLEKYSVNRSFKAIDRSDIVIHMLDYPELIVKQDKKIADYIVKEGKSSILVVNKIDLFQGNIKELEEEIRYRFPHINYVKIFFISAKEKKGIKQVFHYIIELHKRLHTEWKTSELNNLIESIKNRKQILVKNSFLNLFYAVNTSKFPLTFLIFTNKDSDDIPYSYKKFIMNQIRSNYNLESIPLQIIFRNRK